jgi:hypothetical protein
VCIYSDGDGDFRPKVLVDGEKAKFHKAGKWIKIATEDGYASESYIADADYIPHKEMEGV